MSDSDSSEKTEDPTGRKLQKARDEGQVARSIEMPAAAVTIAATAVIVGLGSWLVHRLSQIFAQGMSFDRKALDTPTLMPSIFAAHLTEAMFLLLPVLAGGLAMTLLGAVMFGGTFIGSAQRGVVFFARSANLGGVRSKGFAHQVPNIHALFGAGLFVPLHQRPRATRAFDFTDLRVHHRLEHLQGLA